MENTFAKVKPIPAGFHTITPFLVVDNASGFIKFLKKAFHAQLNYLMEADDGLIRHAELKIGDSILMVSSATEIYKPMPGMFNLYVEDCDQVYEQAKKAGGESIAEPANQFYGDRSAGIKDSWGNQWWIATHVEDVSNEEIKRREAELRHS
ncbi:MAG TPA: VOC family protein [Ignavibacteriaceae bacterium]